MNGDDADHRQFARTRILVDASIDLDRVLRNRWQSLRKVRSETLGSQRLLQLAVNKRPELLCSSLRKSGVIGRHEPVEWLSPLATDAYVEYRDRQAQRRLRLEKRLTVPLREFWPTRGPVWDGLAIAGDDRPILIEAKAHIPEAASPGSKAGPAAMPLIRKSLAATRKHLAPRSKADWSGTFYQYANRLAYQYYLRVLNGIDSSLVFVDFVNAADMDGPGTVAEWRGATRLIHAILGLPSNLTKFSVFHAYVDARQLADVK